MNRSGKLGWTPRRRKQIPQERKIRWPKWLEPVWVRQLLVFGSLPIIVLVVLLLWGDN